VVTAATTDPIAHKFGGLHHARSLERTVRDHGPEAVLEITVDDRRRVAEPATESLDTIRRELDARDVVSGRDRGSHHRSFASRPDFEEPPRRLVRSSPGQKAPGASVEPMSA
jgi:hypothetical protein